MADSLFIVQQQLAKAQADIVTLRTLVDHTIAIIVAAGGRVEIPADKMDEWSQSSWRHENDGVTHTFTTERKPDSK